VPPQVSSPLRLASLLQEVPPSFLGRPSSLFGYCTTTRNFRVLGHIKYLQIAQNINSIKILSVLKIPEF
jgi:hypothetical protein